MYDKLMDRFWRKADGVVWDLLTGNIGVKNREGDIVTLEGEGEGAHVVANPIDNFGMPIPAFAQNTPASSVSIGDFIYLGERPKGWVIGFKDVGEEDKKIRKFTLMSVEGTTTTFTPPKMHVFGLESGVMVLRSLMNLMPNGEDGVTALQGNLMPLLMMGGGDSLDSIMPMMLMNQMGVNGDGASNPFGGNMMQTMMMMKMMNGKDSGFDGGSFFKGLA